MPSPLSSPICKDAWAKLNPGSAVCDLLKNLLLIQEKLFTFWEWMFTDDGAGSCNLSEAFVMQTMAMLQPIGTLVWAPKNLNLDSREWVPADGNEYRKDAYVKLYELYGDDYGDPAFGGRPPTNDDMFRVINLQGRIVLQY